MRRENATTRTIFNEFSMKTLQTLHLDDVRVNIKK